MKIMYLVPHGARRSQALFRVFPLVDQGQKEGRDIFWREIPRRGYARYSFFSRLPYADVIVVHREQLSPYYLSIVRRLCTTLVYDCGDAAWTLPDREIAWWKRAAVLPGLRRGFERMCRVADICIADNLPLAEKMRQFQERVVIIPTGVDEEWFTPGSGGRTGGIPLVGWSGTPGDESYIDEVLEQLMPLAGTVQFSIVTGKPYSGPGKEYTLWSAWSPDSEPIKLQAMNIFLVPKPAGEYMNAGSASDVLKGMSSGLAVVASDVGMARDIIDHGVDGFLVRDASEWVKYVQQLAEKPDMRQRMGEAARAKVVNDYGLYMTTMRTLRTLGA